MTDPRDGMRERTEEDALCVDSSVLVRSLAPDERDDESGHLVDVVKREDIFLYAPSIVQFEFASAFARKERLGRITADRVDENLRHFCGLSLLLIWNENLVARSVALCRKGFKNLYDAAFVAVAMLKRIPLVTVDREMAELARNFHRATFTPGEWLSRMGRIAS